jgi:hypothetical protein
MKKKNKEEIPYFIKIRGCINCDASKSLKEKTGKDYGFDHEIMVKCLLIGCCNYGVDLSNPFYDPEEILRLNEKYKTKQYPERLNNIRKYILHIKERFGKFYEKMDVSLDDMLRKLEEQ